MQWNHRGSGTGGNPVHDSFDGILVQEWSPERGLTGPVTNVWAGTERGLAEAPHLFKRNGWYYLTTAEGGTGYDHAVSMARSRVITGPYETHPNKHLICAADAPDSPIQRTGHGQYVETPDGQVYHSFLMGRPMPGPDGAGRFCPMGRETGLERCTWGDDDWLYLEAGGTLVREELSTPCPMISNGCARPSQSGFSAARAIWC
ncbi:MAG: family 43 glycosylhydrolase, partial [Maritimibacter sp.]